MLFSIFCPSPKRSANGMVHAIMPHAPSAHPQVKKGNTNVCTETKSCVQPPESGENFH